MSFTRILAGAMLTAATLAGAMLVPTTAGAATTGTGSLVTLRGTTEQFPSPGCTRLVTADGTSYELLLPTNPTREQRDLILNGIPLGVQVQVQAMPLVDRASHCMVGPMMEVQSLAVLQTLQGTTQSASPGCTTLAATDGSTYELRLPANPTPDQQDLISNGIPLRAEVQVLVNPLSGVTSSCGTGAVVEVESLTVARLTLDGTAQQDPVTSCTALVTPDGSSYELRLPQFSMFGPSGATIPLGVPIEVSAKPLTGVSSSCDVGPVMEAEYVALA